ncbi:hypothetical protein JCM8547_008695 [Rhodosporidiobolus lusitaniae]
MPPLRPSRPSHKQSTSSSSSSESAPPPPSHRRKGVPRKAPARSMPYPSSSTSPAPPAPSGSSLLRLFLLQQSRPLDNLRFTPPPKQPATKNGKKKVVGTRDQLLPVQEGFGRGSRRTVKSALADDYLPLATSSHRGRSPGVKGKGKETYGGVGRGAYSAGGRRAGSATSSHFSPAAGAGGQSGISSPYYAAPSSYPAELLSVPGSSSSYSAAAGPSGKMSRAASAGGGAGGGGVQYSAGVPSPLARSFSANGTRDARARTPSNPNGAARVAELGGFGLDFSPTANYVAA